MTKSFSFTTCLKKGKCSKDDSGSEERTVKIAAKKFKLKKRDLEIQTDLWTVVFHNQGSYSYSKTTFQNFPGAFSPKIQDIPGVTTSLFKTSQ